MFFFQMVGWFPTSQLFWGSCLASLWSFSFFEAGTSEGNQGGAGGGRRIHCHLKRLRMAYSRTMGAPNKLLEAFLFFIVFLDYGAVWNQATHPPPGASDVCFGQWPSVAPGERSNDGGHHWLRGSDLPPRGNGERERRCGVPKGGLFCVEKSKKKHQTTGGGCRTEEAWLEILSFSCFEAKAHLPSEALRVREVVRLKKEYQSFLLRELRKKKTSTEEEGKEEAGLEELGNPTVRLALFAWSVYWLVGWLVGWFISSLAACSLVCSFVRVLVRNLFLWGLVFLFGDLPT